MGYELLSVEAFDRRLLCGLAEENILESRTRNRASWTKHDSHDEILDFPTVGCVYTRRGRKRPCPTPTEDNTNQLKGDPESPRGKRRNNGIKIATVPSSMTPIQDPRFTQQCQLQLHNQADDDFMLTSATGTASRRKGRNGTKKRTPKSGALERKVVRARSAPTRTPARRKQRKTSAVPLPSPSSARTATEKILSSGKPGPSKRILPDVTEANIICPEIQDQRLTRSKLALLCRARDVTTQLSGVLKADEGKPSPSGQVTTRVYSAGSRGGVVRAQRKTKFKTKGVAGGSLNNWVLALLTGTGVESTGVRGGLRGGESETRSTDFTESTQTARAPGGEGQGGASVKEQELSTAEHPAVVEFKPAAPSAGEEVGAHTPPPPAEATKDPSAEERCQDAWSVDGGDAQTLSCSEGGGSESTPQSTWQQGGITDWITVPGQSGLRRIRVQEQQQHVGVTSAEGTGAEERLGGDGHGVPAGEGEVTLAPAAPLRTPAFLLGGAAMLGALPENRHSWQERGRGLQLQLPCRVVREVGATWQCLPGDDVADMGTADVSSKHMGPGVSRRAGTARALSFSPPAAVGLGAPATCQPSIYDVEIERICKNIADIARWAAEGGQGSASKALPSLAVPVTADVSCNRGVGEPGAPGAGGVAPIPTRARSGGVPATWQGRGCMALGVGSGASGGSGEPEAKGTQAEDTRHEPERDGVRLRSVAWWGVPVMVGIVGVASGVVNTWLS